MVKKGKVVVSIVVLCIFVILGGIFIQHKALRSFKSTIGTSWWYQEPHEFDYRNDPHELDGPNQPLVSDSLKDEHNLKSTHEPKLILFWTALYGGKWHINTDQQVCGRYSCLLTYDKEQYGNASAVMFHHRTNWLDILPTDRPRIPSQRWVLYNRESSWWGPKGELLNKANNLINWTMGFRHDNDITVPTANLLKRPFKGGFDPSKNYLAEKTGNIAGLMSACIYYPHPGYESRRKYLASLVARGLKFDMYGKCGKDCGGSFSSCSKILKNYKFVLAFENSLCDEYISEKPYRNGLMLGVVPVIMLGANLSDPNLLPSGSYIDAGQFSSVSALVEFLKKVGSDPKLYNKYFEWRKDWDIELISENEGQEDFPNNYFCPLCTKLHEDFTPKIYGNVREWYEQEKCKEYPKMSA